MSFNSFHVDYTWIPITYKGVEKKHEKEKVSTSDPHCGWIRAPSIEVMNLYM